MTVKIYNEIINLGCDDWNSAYAPLTEIYQYYAIAYEQMGKFDSAAYVLLDGLDKSPNNDVLIKRLEYSRRHMNQLKKVKTKIKNTIHDIDYCITMSNEHLENANFKEALGWADKAIALDYNRGDGYAQKGKVYFTGWDNYRKNPFTIDDRIVALISYLYSIEGEKRGHKGISRKDWLEENKKDIMYGKAQWFMATDRIKRANVIKTTRSEYDWVSDHISFTGGKFKLKEDQNREQKYVRSNSNVKKYPKPKYPADLALKINFIEPSGNLPSSPFSYPM